VDSDDALYELQRTLYTSKNPTRRWLHVSRRDWIATAIRRWSRGGRGRSLEIGPGSGIYLPVLLDNAAEVVAADIEDAYLDRLTPIADDYSALRLVRDDITRSSFPDGHFDLILCTEVIEHIADSQTALAEMRRLLLPGGVLILSTPQKYSPLELGSKIAFLPGVIDLVRLVYREPVLETGHINLLTKPQLRFQLNQAGFDVVDSHQGGVYLPVIAETMGDTALRVEKALERRLLGTRLEWLLWTQYVIASPR
jgi:SAM-dependent methyltransferase